MGPLDSWQGGPTAHHTPSPAWQTLALQGSDLTREERHLWHFGLVISFKKGINVLSFKQSRCQHVKKISLMQVAHFIKNFTGTQDTKQLCVHTTVTPLPPQPRGHVPTSEGASE